MGFSNVAASQCAGVSRTALETFFNNNPGSREYFNSLRQTPTLKARENLIRSISGQEVPQAVDVKLCCWWMEKKCRDEFGSDMYILEREKLESAAAQHGSEGSGPCVIPAELVAPEFANFFRDVKEHRYTHFREPGGRGAGRSSAISIAVVNLLMTRPDIHALVCRKVGKTIRDSVFAQIIWAIEALGLTAQFKVNRSIFLIKRLATDQHVYFRGLDDPFKIKSIKPPFGHIGVFWLEEADQTFGEEELRPVRQSVMRGGEDFWVFESWNTPRSKQHWINRRLVDDADRADVRTHHSTYLNLPVEWLGQPFVDEAEALKATNEAAYRHEYLGEAIGYGGEVFERVSLERLSDETLAGFDNIRNGIDWGFAVDPLAFVRAHYDKTRKVVYVFDELVATNLTDDEAAKLIKARGIDGRNLITADCADPKSIENWRRLGFQIRGCTKFPGSLGHGVKFLQGLTLIVIDPVRCPVAAREFPNYGLKRDANGVYQAVINQVNDHTIDALRYALDTEIAAHREAQTGFVGAR